MTESSRDRKQQRSHVHLEGVQMHFGDNRVLRGVDLEVPRGQIGVIVGGSGSGKTTLVRIIIGLLRPSTGRVLIDGQDIAQLDGRQLRQVRAKCGMVFQYSALLDSLTVMDNVALPLREHERLPAQTLRDRVLEMLAVLGLEGTEGKYPGELSGGMRKRVSLARALIRRPSLIVYDEPASGLDPVTARKVDDLIAETRDRYDVTSIVISHSMAQAVRLADRMYVLADGRVDAEGSVDELRGATGSLAAAYFEASRIDAP